MFDPVSTLSDRPSVPGLTGLETLPACGFKEWSLVCEALGAGAQSLILRKGGIHEGRGGFWWKHGSFFLFPTRFHEQDVQFTWNGKGEESAPVSPAEPAEDRHEIRFFAEVDFKMQITSRQIAEALQPWHFWIPEVVHQRFDYTDEAGISLAFLRIFRLNRPWSFPDERRFGGCRSWLDLPAVPEDLALTPVISDAEHAGRRAAVRALLGPEIPAAAGADCNDKC